MRSKENKHGVISPSIISSSILCQTLNFFLVCFLYVLFISNGLSILFRDVIKRAIDIGGKNNTSCFKNLSGEAFVFSPRRGVNNLASLQCTSYHLAQKISSTGRLLTKVKYNSDRIGCSMTRRFVKKIQIGFVLKAAA